MTSKVWLFENRDNTIYWTYWWRKISRHDIVVWFIILYGCLEMLTFVQTITGIQNYFIKGSENIIATKLACYVHLISSEWSKPITSKTKVTVNLRQIAHTGDLRRFLDMRIVNLYANVLPSHSVFPTRLNLHFQCILPFSFGKVQNEGEANRKEIFTSSFPLKFTKLPIKLIWNRDDKWYAIALSLGAIFTSFKENYWETINYFYLNIFLAMAVLNFGSFYRSRKYPGSYPPPY